MALETRPLLKTYQAYSYRIKNLGMYVHSIQLVLFYIIIIDDITKHTDQILQAMYKTSPSKCTHNFRI